MSRALGIDVSGSDMKRIRSSVYNDNLWLWPPLFIPMKSASFLIATNPNPNPDPGAESGTKTKLVQDNK